MGCSGETARTRLARWEQAGTWARIHLDMLRLLRRDGELEHETASWSTRRRAGARDGELEHETAVVDSVIVRAHGGGEATGQGIDPSPVDRGKPGTKYTLVVDAGGAALGVRVTGANASDQKRILPLVREEFPAVAGKPGRPRRKPVRVLADAGYDSESTPVTTASRRRLRQRVDAGYDSESTRNVLRCLGIEPLIRKTQEGGRARQRPGQGPLGRRADDQSGQGPQTTAATVRSQQDRHGRLDDAGHDGHQLPHPVP